MDTDEVKRVHTDRMIAEAIRNRQEREQGYREQALKLYPWVCGRCGREFTHANLRQLTVHHRDHDHDNNPKDGSNWELLCLYCHDNEHARELDAEAARLAGAVDDADSARATSQPFADLKEMLKKNSR
jgi:5-methylcytosine-specific restriction endonuclease McrA